MSQVNLVLFLVSKFEQKNVLKTSLITLFRIYTPSSQHILMLQGTIRTVNPLCSQKRVNLHLLRRYT